MWWIRIKVEHKVLGTHKPYPVGLYIRVLTIIQNYSKLFPDWFQTIIDYDFSY
jgi:hypothetical protein